MKQDKIAEKYFFYGLVIAVIIFLFFVFVPFLGVIALSATLSVVMYPFYNWLLKIIGGKAKWVASLLTIIIFLIVIFGPLFLLGKIVFEQSQDVYLSFTHSGNADPLINKIGNSINDILPTGFNIDLHEKISGLVTLVTNNVATIFTSTLSTLFSFVLLILSMFYFLKDSVYFKKVILMISPLDDKEDNIILDRLSLAINGIFKGYLLIGLIQGILAGIGLAVFGVPHPALWGVLAAIASLVPSVGTAIITIPAVIYLFATGNPGFAIGYAVWAALIVGTVDNFLNPLIVGKKLNIPPILVLFAVLGGVSFMGPIGVIFGPLALSLLFVLVSIHRNKITVVPES